MATAKIILRKHKQKKDGSHPLVLRITTDRKSQLVFLGVYIHEKDWNEKESIVKKSHPNSGRINNLILKKLAEVNDHFLTASSKNKKISAGEVKGKLKRKSVGKSFFALVEDRRATYIKLGKHSVANSDHSKAKNFKAFLNGEDISFSDITVPLLERFKVFLSTSRSKNGIVKKTSQRYIANHLLFIRTLYNVAISEGIVDSQNYPFGKGKIQIKLPESLKIGLDESEVLAIEGLELEIGSSLFHARNKWLFSFYFAGMRISDVLQTKWTDFIDERLTYRMGKNQKLVSVKIPEKLNGILDYYRQFKTKRDDFIFPDMKTANLKDKKDIYRKLNSAVKNTNERLETIAKKAGIEKKLTNHIARHTFGNIAGDKISPQMLQKLYRHSDIRTTMGYQANFIHKSADEALDSVINF